MSVPFTGAPLAIETVTQTGAASVRLRYTNYPLTASVAGVHDGINPANYSLSGPVTGYTVTSVTAVSSDLQAVDVFFSAPLVEGTWTLSVSNVQTPEGNSLVAPTSLAFNALSLEGITNLAQGAESDNAESRLRKFLSPAFSGRGWEAMLAALAVGDQYREDLADAAFDQLFKASATGVYLDRRSSADGFTRPSGIGISEEVFRTLSIKTTARKQIVGVILEILEAYYGSEATRAYVTSSTAEPYSLQSGDTLIVKPDSGPAYTVVFNAQNFATIGAATALEVAAAITLSLRDQGSSAYAEAFLDPSLGQTFVRIFSGALGLRGSMAVAGGRAQNTLLFPKLVHAAGVGPVATTVFAVVAGTGLNGVAAGRVRFTYNSGANPTLQAVLPGDYVNIFGSEFAGGLRSTYAVLASSPTYVEIETTDPAWGIVTTVTLTSSSSMRFYRPTSLTIQSTGRMATATQGDPSVLEVILPATTQAVSRTPKTGAYLHAGTTMSITSASRSSSGVVTVTAAGHGLVSGQSVIVESLQPSNSIVGNNPAWISGDALSTVTGAAGMAMVLLSNGKVLVAGGGSTASYLLDPTGTTWVATGSMATSRTNLTLTVLANGKVLAVGGGSATCELYDPSSGVWTPTGSCNVSRTSHVAALLSNGKVLVAGGASATAETYDPVTGTWTATAVPAANHVAGTATTLNDGRVLVCCGGTAVSEIYNPVNGTWTTTSALSASLSKHAAVALADGKVLVTGGTTDGTTPLATTYIFNPATQAFMAGSAMVTARMGHALVSLSNGTFLAIGGNTSTCEVHDPIQKTWTATTSLANSRSSVVAVKLTDGRVVANGLSAPTSNAVIFSISSVPLTAGGLNGTFVVTVVNSSTFTYTTVDFQYATTAISATGQFTPCRAPSTTIKGPYLYDTQGSPSITSTATTSVDQLVSGTSYTVFTVADASAFPDEPGYLVFNFGSSTQLSPVKYLGRISNSLLLLDPSYTFPATISPGSTVTLLNGRGVWTPANPELVGSFYITGASSGRVSASDMIDSLTAYGVTVVKTVVYPSDIGLGNEGQPDSGQDKISDRVYVWGGDEPDLEIAAARED